MASGSPTPLETVERFRAHYLYSGNASESARKVGLPESTGRDIAQQLVDDPEFVEARRRLRTRALDDLVALRMRIANKAASRMLGSLPMPESVSSGATVTIVDKRADYGKLVLEAEKNAHHLAKIEAENGGDQEREREVIVRFEPIKKKPDEKP